LRRLRDCRSTCSAVNMPKVPKVALANVKPISRLRRRSAFGSRVDRQPVRLGHLTSGQIGVDAKLLEFGRFSIDGLIKVGVFDNNAKQSALVSMAKTLFPTQATTNHVAFVGEAALQAKYQLAKGLALKVGYEALWLDGVALAPGQIRETYTSAPPTASARARGVNTGSSVLFQGVTAGLEYSF
jgi:hypothetical protein